VVETDAVCSDGFGPFVLQLSLFFLRLCKLTPNGHVSSECLARELDFLLFVIFATCRGYLSTGTHRKTSATDCCRHFCFHCIYGVGRSHGHFVCTPDESAYLALSGEEDSYILCEPFYVCVAAACFAMRDELVAAHRVEFGGHEVDFLERHFHHLVFALSFLALRHRTVIGRSKRGRSRSLADRTAQLGYNFVRH